MMKTFPAFTVIETVVTITLMVIVIGMVTSWTSYLLRQAQLQTTAETMVSLTRSLRTAAHEGVNATNHGIHLELDQYITFAGTDFASSQPEDRQTHMFSPTIQLSNIVLNGGGIDIVFLNEDGSTSQSGFFQLSHSSISDVYTIMVSKLGLTDWQ